MGFCGGTRIMGKGYTTATTLTVIRNPAHGSLAGRRKSEKSTWMQLLDISGGK